MDNVRERRAMGKLTVVLLMILVILANFSLGCDDISPVNSAQKLTEAADIGGTIEAVEQGRKDAERSNILENPDEKIVFSYSGEHQSYHTGLRNRTIFSIDYDRGKVLASESATYEEPAGCNTEHGTDTVSFDGNITNGVVIEGTLKITTDSTASGCEGTTHSSTLKYSMTGTLTAELADGQWTGKVTGTATLKQTWSDETGPAVDDTYPIEWTIVGVFVE